MDGAEGTVSIIIFGASGDLARRKLLPSLFSLHRKGRLPADVRVWGAARSPWSDDELRANAREAVSLAGTGPVDEEAWSAFARILRYHRTDIMRGEDMAALDQAIAADTRGGDSRLLYLSTAPAQYPALLEGLGESGMGRAERGYRRVVIEKPFGVDLASAKALNATAHAAFREEQIFRIDHYLAKETVQNMLVFRFANALFEPVWNRNYVHAVHVLVAEAVGVEHRASYYETAGVLRDMFQNHLLQLLTLVAMEPPARFEADALRNEKLKVLQAITPIEGQRLAVATARGQYEGYRNEPDVAPESEIATYGAMRLHVDNWRWQGVPFILESGKALKSKVTEVVVKFRQPPLQLFRQARGAPTPNAITIRLQPNEGMHLTCQAKEPGEGMVLRPVEMDFSYASEFDPRQVADAYERVLIDALHGDASLFMRSDEIERAWRLMDPIIEGWASEQAPPLEIYRRGSWGPPGAERIRGGLVAPPTR
jgi:glucose-6-phosphate 1-dehydrogenase